MTQPNKYYYKFDQNELVDIDGVLVTANALLPQITLGQKPTINVQLVNDDMTPFTGLASGTVAQLMVDTDFKNDAVPVPLGASGWTNSTGSEYRKYLAYEPESVLFGGTAGTEGTIGTLTAGSWAYDTATDRLYVRLPDSGDPSSKANNYVTAEFDASDATPPYIECYSDSFNTTGSWYTTSGTFATPDVTQGQLAFALNANTVNYYQRIGTQERAQGNAQIQFYFGGENIANRKMTMILWNRITGSGESAAVLELDGIGYYTKAESDSRFLRVSGLGTSTYDASGFLIAQDSTGVTTKLPQTTFLQSSSLRVADSTAATDALTDSSLLSEKYRETLAEPNLIVNGAMEVSQENGTSVVVKVNGGGYAYIVDGVKMALNTTNACQLSASQNTAVPNASFKSSVFVTVSAARSSPSNGDFTGIFLPVEGIYGSKLRWGTSSARYARVSGWVYTSVAGTYGFFVTGSYSYCHPVSLSAGWNYVSFRVAPAGIGTSWLTAEGQLFAAIGIDLGSGTNYQVAADTWTSGANLIRGATQTDFVGTAGAQLYATGFQVYANDYGINRPFPHKTYSEYQRECKRYFRILGTGMPGRVASATQVAMYESFEEPMAYAPALSLVTTSPVLAVLGVGSITGSGSAIESQATKTTGVEYCVVNGFTGATAGGVISCSTEKFLKASARI